MPSAEASPPTTRQLKDYIATAVPHPSQGMGTLLRYFDRVGADRPATVQIKIRSDPGTPIDKVLCQHSDGDNDILLARLKEYVPRANRQLRESTTARLIDGKAMEFKLSEHGRHVTLAAVWTTPPAVPTHHSPELSQFLLLYFRVLSPPDDPLDALLTLNALTESLASAHGTRLALYSTGDASFAFALSQLDEAQRPAFFHEVISLILSTCTARSVRPCFASLGLKELQAVYATTPMGLLPTFDPLFFADAARPIDRVAALLTDPGCCIVVDRAVHEHIDRLYRCHPIDASGAAAILARDATQLAFPEACLRHPLELPSGNTSTPLAAPSSDEAEYIARHLAAQYQLSTRAAVALRWACNEYRGADLFSPLTEDIQRCIPLADIHQVFDAAPDDLIRARLQQQFAKWAPMINDADVFADLALAMARGHTLPTAGKRTLNSILISLLWRLNEVRLLNRRPVAIVVDNAGYADELTAELICELEGKAPYLATERPLPLVSVHVRPEAEASILFSDDAFRAGFNAWKDARDTDILRALQAIAADSSLKRLTQLALGLGWSLHESWLLQAFELSHRPAAATARSEATLDLGRKCIGRLLQFGVLRRARTVVCDQRCGLPPVFQDAPDSLDFELVFESLAVHERLAASLGIRGDEHADVFFRLGEMLISRASSVREVRHPHAVCSLFQDRDRLAAYPKRRFVASLWELCGKSARRAGAPQEATRRLEMGWGLVADARRGEAELAAGILVELLRAQAARREPSDWSAERRLEWVTELRERAKKARGRLQPSAALLAFRLLRAEWNLCHNWIGPKMSRDVLQGAERRLKDVDFADNRLAFELEFSHMQAVTYFATGELTAAWEACCRGRDACLRLTSGGQVPVSGDVFGSSHDGAVCCKCMGAITRLMLDGSRREREKARELGSHKEEAGARLSREMTSGEWFGEVIEYVRGREGDVTARFVMANFACLYWLLQGETERAKSSVEEWMHDWHPYAELSWLSSPGFLLQMIDAESRVPFGRPWKNTGSVVEWTVSNMAHGRRGVDFPWFENCGAASSLVASERNAEAIEVLSSAISFCESVGNRFFIADLYRRRAAVRECCGKDGWREDVTIAKATAISQQSELWLARIREDADHYHLQWEEI